MYRSIFVIGAFVTVILLLGVQTSEVKAGGFANLDIGGMRCCMLSIVGKPFDPTAVYHNPAGLAEQKGRSFYSSLLLASVHTKFKLRYSDGTTSEKVTPDIAAGMAPFVGYTDDFGSDRLTFGIGFYFPNFYGASLPEDAPTRFHVIKGWFITGYVTPALAYKLTDKFSVGAGLSYIYVSLYGNRKFGDWENPDEDQLEGDLEVEGEEHAVGGIIGLLYRPVRKLHIGLSWTPQVDLTMEGPFKFDYGNIDIDGTQYTEMPIPMSLRLGLNYQFTPKFEMGLDISYWDYSVYDVQKTRTEPEMFIDLSAVKDYSDSYNIGCGFRYQWTDKYGITGGLQYDFSPIPDKTYSLENPQSDLYGFALGMTWQYSARTNMNFAFVHNQYEHKDIDNSETFPPTNGEGKGNNTELSLALHYHF